MNKVLVIPDIHCRTFWKEPCKHIENFEKVIFLGDYLDPYGFEGLTFEDGIKNLKEIIQLKKDNMDKVVLLYGNHDCPYAFEEYYDFSDYHSRHSKEYHDEVHQIFEENKNLFKFAFVVNDIIFTHAGIESEWLDRIIKCNSTDANVICKEINDLIHIPHGLRKLYYITSARDGMDRCRSCIWTDVYNMMWDVDSITSPDTIIKPIHNIKQVFGHTIQAFYDKNGKIVFGNAIEFRNCKMLDTARAYELDCDAFTITEIRG